MKAGFLRRFWPCEFGVIRGPGSGDRGPGTGDRGPGTGDRGPGTGDRGPGSGDRGPGTGDRGPGTGVIRCFYLSSITFTAFTPDGAATSRDARSLISGPPSSSVRTALLSLKRSEANR